MTSSTVRQSFLDYFASHDHEIVRSGSLVPLDDPTLLFTNAGMNQFKDLFLGRERRDYQRATTSQKCMRVSGKHNDLDNVGPSLRHHTFFEMLGNFSFGDYFKHEAIPFAWTLLTEVWNLPAERLYPTVFKGMSGIPRDDDAHAIWSRLVPSERIIELGVAENFWAMGDTGPCGRCSEVHYFRGDDIECHEPVCRGVDCSCERYLEIWNNVFMEFNRDNDGTLTDLPAASIDTGMGLERIVAVIQGKASNYDTDLFTPLLRAIEAQTDRTYGPLHPQQQNTPHDVSMRVVADHLRAMTFLIADGVMPSNEWRGYVLRKIMRRAMRHGKKLGMTAPFLHQLVDVLVDEMSAAYPELSSGRDSITRIVRTEEERFDAVLTDGLPRLETVLAEAGSSGQLSGAEMFRLYDTYGLPLDFMEDLATEHSVTIDRKGFEQALESQRTQSRAHTRFGNASANTEFQFASDQQRAELTVLPDHFEGYTTTDIEDSIIIALFDDQRMSIDSLTAPANGYVVLDKTPFYLEAGGQVSDTGHLVVPSEASLPSPPRAVVDGMERLAPGGPRAHHIQLTQGVLHPGNTVLAQVDAVRRSAIRRNHTATHLLHAALRRQLGSHVKQAGSLVAPDRLRFDFSHDGALVKSTLEAVEREINHGISANHPVETQIRTTEEAIAGGAMALFGEKYGSTVRVVSLADVSMELCGGTHCHATGDIGLLTITQETGVAAGVRRIEAVTSNAAVAHMQADRANFDALVQALGVPADGAISAVKRLQADTKRLTRELEQLKMKSVLGSATESHNEATISVGDAKLIARRVSGLEKSALRTLADSLRSRLGRGVVVLASDNDGKVALVVSVSKDLLDTLHAGKIVKALAPIVGGGGGGRADFAEAGGRQPEKINNLLSASQSVIERMLEDQEPEPK
jgi:alanyl-tRNA synthetase